LYGEGLHLLLGEEYCIRETPLKRKTLIFIGRIAGLEITNPDSQSLVACIEQPDNFRGNLTHLKWDISLTERMSREAILTMLARTGFEQPSFIGKSDAPLEIVYDTPSHHPVKQTLRFYQKEE